LVCGTYSIKINVLLFVVLLLPYFQILCSKITLQYYSNLNYGYFKSKSLLGHESVAFMIMSNMWLLSPLSPISQIHRCLEIIIWFPYETISFIRKLCKLDIITLSYTCCFEWNWTRSSYVISYIRVLKIGKRLLGKIRVDSLH